MIIIILTTAVIILTIVTYRITNHLHDLKHELVFSQVGIKKHECNINKLNREINSLKKQLKKE